MGISLGKYNECRYYVILSRCLIIGIRQFKHYVIWKECWLKYEEGGETDSEGVMEKDNFDKKGISNNLRPKSKSSMKGSDKLESFLTQVKIELLSIVWDT